MGKHTSTALELIPASEVAMMTDDLVEQLREIQYDNMDLRESLADLQRGIEDLGWIPLGGFSTEDLGLPLDAVRRMTSTTRPLLAGNGMVKRGVNARIGYIWGEGVTITGNRTRDLIKANQDTVFSVTAQAELESAAATDGNVIFLLDNSTHRMLRIPMGQITGIVADPTMPETKWFIKRTWSVQVIDPVTNDLKTEDFENWYPTLDFLDAKGQGSVPGRIAGVEVLAAQALYVFSFNSQIGWQWGIPDLLPALFWAKAYKEFLESQYTLVRSLARYAFKVTDATKAGAGAKKAAIKVAVPQTADAMGNRTDTGATAVMSAGLDLAAVNKAGASVDFSAGRPLAAMVAAALDLPLNVILAESDQGEAADLDVPTVKAMQFRQQQWSEGLVRMFAYLGARTAKIVFPPIQAAPLHRVIQAIVTAASAGVLFPSEVRDLIVKALRSYGIDPKAGLPDPGEWKAYASPQAANPGTPPQQTPNDTATGPPDQRTAGGALADGDHEMRKSQGST